MINPELNRPEASQAAPASLFDTIVFPGNAHCEAFSSPTQPREHWQPLITALDATGAEMLNLRQDRVRRMRHEDGATYNPFDDPTGKGTPWSLEMIPLPITAGEWAGLEAGLAQRARLLEKILADIYGPQRLLKEGWIPSELIFANSNFLRPCHGIQPAGSRFLTYYAADLYRGADGRFRVFRDYGGNPAGLGYALENRIVISRVFPELYHQTQIRRLAPFFHTFHHSLIQRASLRRDDPGIVLLSPGPDSRIYFEHALLSRYLGYPLVEGQDLTVRNGKVFLKKLAGLEPVEAIIRLTSDDSSDPFALRRETATGVAGLIQVSREQNIDIVNPIGSGFVDTPVLSVFLPELCQRLTGENLLLENHPAWWCGTADGRDYVLANLESLIVGPAMDRSTPPPLPTERMAAIQASPYTFMAREPVRPSVVPAWDRSSINSRNMLLRVFACATDEGFTVMPGGLAITAADVDTLIGGSPEHQQSKDIWVLSDQPVEPFSLMGGLQAVAEFRRSSDLPSRVADHLLWLGRYLERAEGLVRLLRSVFRRLSGEARPGDIPELLFLLNLLRADRIFPPAADDGVDIPRYRELSAHLNAALYDKDRPESVVAILKRVQDAARNVRDRLSLDSWRVINRLEDFADNPASDPLELLDDTLFTLSAFSGLAMESMTRGLGWRFMDMGRRVERAMNQAGLIRIGLPQVCGEFRSALEALLEVADSIMTYRARYRSAYQLPPVLDLLIVDESNPKSLAFQFSQLVAHVEHLPRQNDRRFASPEERLALEMLTAVRLLDLTGLRCSKGVAQTGALADFLDLVDVRLKDFAQQISAHYLTRVQATPHYSTIPGDRQP
ncbi:circularly permuted type 2 ATP-grasp protein [uncultured Desulfosarcina sp.]|uniref:circularly permuted type 2 ATP-grasp protein n=1 Tax=uncultured Desulfosarcina sp. TaxID=218289 RepID=UPI003748A868